MICNITKRLQVTISHRQRSCCRWELGDYANAGRPTHFNLMVGSPKHHRWWAFSLWIVWMPKAKGL